jgi:hypothetical protein
MAINGENFWAGQALTSTHAGVSSVYVFPTNLPGGESENCGYYCMLSPTREQAGADRDAGFAASGSSRRTMSIPNGFLRTDGGTVNFAGVDQVAYASLPTDGVNAINRNGAMVQNRATNFAGASASVSLPQTPAVLNFQGMWWAAPAGIETAGGSISRTRAMSFFATWFTHD